MSTHPSPGPLACPEINDSAYYKCTTVSDIKIKFSDREYPAHKLVLMKKSMYFYKAFTGSFPIATSDTVDLGSEENIEAMEAMLRHFYSLPYEEGTQDLAFHIDVFMAADKYDVPSLRSDIVKSLDNLFTQNMTRKRFVKAIQRLCGPDAEHFADNEIKKSAIIFCVNNFGELYKANNTFAKTMAEGELFGSAYNDIFLTTLSQRMYVLTAKESAASQVLLRMEQRRADRPVDLALAGVMSILRPHGAQ